MAGHHYLVDLRGCDSSRINDLSIIDSALRRIAELTGAEVLGRAQHKFEPQGVTLVLVVSASHFAFHSWPEHRYAAVDLFFCEGRSDVDVLIDSLREAFAAEETSVTLTERNPVLPKTMGLHSGS